jgi:multidrug resistance efflux pump
MIDSRDTELATLRADLAEARADVARFEAALDAANRELANELTERDAARAEAKRLQDLIERRRIEKDDIRASAARWEERALKAEAELAQARARVEVLGNIVDQENGRNRWYRTRLVRDRRTILALVVAARALDNAMWNYTSAADRYGNGPTRMVKAYIKKQSGQQAGE